MTIDLIIQLIASLTGTGGLIALFLITEKKTVMWTFLVGEADKTSW